MINELAGTIKDATSATVLGPVESKKFKGVILAMVSLLIILYSPAVHDNITETLAQTAMMYHAGILSIFFGAQGLHDYRMASNAAKKDK